jgi:hypothetical protein
MEEIQSATEEGNDPILNRSVKETVNQGTGNEGRGDRSRLGAQATAKPRS